MLALALAAVVQGADTMGVMDTTDRHATMAAEHQMADPRADDPHMKLSAARPLTAADSARGAALVAQIRAALVVYRDVQAARADGYRQFLPGVAQPVYHFTSRFNAVREMWRPSFWRFFGGMARAGGAKPTKIEGADTFANGEQLDVPGRPRVVATPGWHEHVNWCVPPPGARERWTETKAGGPVFGPKSPIATPDACAAAGGRFLPRIFGWMVHVTVFGSDDPRVIWGHAHEH